jgi:hypothetical protein
VYATVTVVASVATVESVAVSVALNPPFSVMVVVPLNVTSGEHPGSAKFTGPAKVFDEQPAIETLMFV